MQLIIRLSECSFGIVRNSPHSHSRVLIAAVNKSTINPELHFFNNCFGNEFSEGKLYCYNDPRLTCKRLQYTWSTVLYNWCSYSTKYICTCTFSVHMLKIWTYYLLLCVCMFLLAIKVLKSSEVHLANIKNPTFTIFYAI